MRNVVMKGAESKRASAMQGWMQFWNSGSLELGLGQRLHSLCGRPVFFFPFDGFLATLQGFPRKPQGILYTATIKSDQEAGPSGSFSHKELTVNGPSISGHKGLSSAHHITKQPPPPAPRARSTGNASPKFQFDAQASTEERTVL